MEENSYLICDSNICVYRTLANIEPKIYDELIHKVKDRIARHTNDYNAEIVVTKTVKSEIMDENEETYILPKIIRDFCVERLKYKPYDYNILKLQKQATKSLRKFTDKNRIEKKLPCFQAKHKYINIIKNFYLNHPDILEKITEEKVRKAKKPKEKRRQRPDNLPEKGDLKLLSECIEIKESREEPVALFSQDSDYTNFKEKIREEFEINIEHV